MSNAAVLNNHKVSLSWLRSCAVLAALLAAPVTFGQAEDGEPLAALEGEAVSVQDADGLEADAHRLLLFDGRGNVISESRQRANYSRPVLSPDGARVAVLIDEPERDVTDLWIWNLGTGDSRRLTAFDSGQGIGQAGDAHTVWSPDSREIAYTALRGSNLGVYRRMADGSGGEQALYEHFGEPLVLTGWSSDGNAVSFVSEAGGPGSTEHVLHLLPIDESEPVAEVRFRESEFDGARLSPDGRFVAYRSYETGRHEIFVRRVAFETSAAGELDDKWQVSTDGGHGMIRWSADNRALFYLAADRSMMVVDVATEPEVSFGAPRLVSGAASTIPMLMGPDPSTLGDISDDGQQAVFVVRQPRPLQQLTIFDRQGSVVGTVGPPGLYRNPQLSPDGQRLLAEREMPESGYRDLWTFDVTAGMEWRVTNDWLPEFYPAWYPDGRIAYTARRGDYWGVYLRAPDGAGEESLMYRDLPGVGITLGDFSADGRLMSFVSGGVMWVAPSSDHDPLARRGVEFLRTEYSAVNGRFSPNTRFFAYASNESVNESDPWWALNVYVQEFDAESLTAAEGKWRLSDRGEYRGGLSWRQDGKELYFLRAGLEAAEAHVMAVRVTTDGEFQAAEPRELFRLPAAPAVQKFVSRDGERFVFPVPVSQVELETN